MKQHIGPIYLILGLMAVSALTIGAGKPMGEAHNASAQALLPSPMSFRIQVAREKAAADRLLVIDSQAFDAEIEAKVARALASAKGRKAG
jgi:hypothetical protein